MTVTRPRRWLLAAPLFLLIAACGGAPATPTEPSSSAFLTGGADADYEAGMRAWRAGDGATAESSFRSALASNPRYLAAHLGLGDVLLARADYAGAYTAYDNALALRPTNVDALLGRGQARLGTGDSDGAIGDAGAAQAEAVEMDSRELQARAEVLRGSAHQVAGRGDDAIAAYERALELEATALDARTSLARLYAGRYRTDDAIRLLMRGEDYVQTADQFQRLAASYVALGSCDRALPLLEAADELAPGDADVRYHLALCETRTGDHETAIALATDLLRERPGNAQAALVRAEARWRRGLYDAARADLLAVLESDPENGEAIALQADIDADLGNHEVAVAGYQRALIARPHDTRLVSRVAEYAATHHEPDWVVEVLEPRIDQPERPARWLALLSTALRDIGRERDAIPYASAYATTRPNDHRLHFAAAESALEHPGSLDPDQTVRHARLAIEHVGGAPLTHRVLLIDALLAAGLTAEARDVYEIARDAFPNAVELRERRDRFR